MSKENINIKISVVIPTSDRGLLLKKAVESVLNQTVMPKKIIIVDNGRQPVGFSFDDSIVEIIRTVPRLGSGKPRNIGAEHCDTQYIAFLDDDDWWETDYIEHTMNRFLKSNADVVVGQLRHHEMNGDVWLGKSFPSSAELQRQIFYTNPGFQGSNIAVKKDVFTEVGGFDERLPASVDRDLAAKFVIAGKRIVFEPQSVCLFYKHDGERVSMHKGLIKGNYLFLRKYWKYMSNSERYRGSVRYAKTLRRFLKRWLLSFFK